MNLQTMYPPAVNSKPTVTMGVLDINTTSVIVLDATVLPDAPNLLVLGADNTAETVLMTKKEGNTLTIQRGVEGVAKSWAAGTEIARNFTAGDLEAVQENIQLIAEQAEKADNNASRLNQLEYMILHNDYFAPLAAEDEEGSIIIDNDGTPILANWKYKEA